MSRQIKFRAWDKVNCTMISDPFAWFDVVEGIVNPAAGQLTANHPDNRHELLQFTGLFDSKGVDIYEGDIISDHVGVGVVEWRDRKGAYTVNYNNGRAKWFIDYSLRGEFESIEVIGNIYEHKHLLVAL